MNDLEIVSKETETVPNIVLPNQQQINIIIKSDGTIDTNSSKKTIAYLSEEQEKKIMKNIKTELRKEFNSYEKMIDSYKMISTSITFILALCTFWFMTYLQKENLTDLSDTQNLLNIVAKLYPTLYSVPIVLLFCSLWKTFKVIIKTIIIIFKNIINVDYWKELFNNIKDL